MRNPEIPEHRKDPGRDEPERSERRPTFDISDLHNIPRTTDDDPPYQSWWVVIDNGDR
jgi:hypothetical protein